MYPNYGIIVYFVWYILHNNRRYQQKSKLSLKRGSSYLNWYGLFCFRNLFFDKITDYNEGV